MIACHLYSISSLLFDYIFNSDYFEHLCSIDIFNQLFYQYGTVDRLPVAAVMCCLLLLGDGSPSESAHID